ncbi:MAG: hypothetical protein HYW65_03280 [Candidatus Liptonbacteria bacterium]|nr:hypothetical protein [Candidatus Liptonbacteria bacterium]
MRVYLVNPWGAWGALPTILKEEGRFAFRHGNGNRSRSWEYCLRLSKRDFPMGQEHNWGNTHFVLLPDSAGQKDELGNPFYFLKKGEPSQECLVFLDMQPCKEGLGILHARNEGVRVLGYGLEIRNGGKGSRKTHEVEYPVLICAPGAEFSWERSGRKYFGKERSYKAQWDGTRLSVRAEIPLLPRYAEEHLATRGWLRI